MPNATPLVEVYLICEHNECICAKAAVFVPKIKKDLEHWSYWDIVYNYTDDVDVYYIILF